MISTLSGLMLELNLKILVISENQDILNYETGNISVLNFFHSSKAFDIGLTSFDFESNARVFQALSPNYPILATAGDDCYLLIWSTIYKTLLLALQISERPTCLRFSPNGKHLVIGCHSGKAYIYELIITPLSEKGVVTLNVECTKPSTFHVLLST